MVNEISERQNNLEQVFLSFQKVKQVGGKTRKSGRKKWGRRMNKVGPVNFSNPGLRWATLQAWARFSLWAYMIMGQMNNDHNSSFRISIANSKPVCGLSSISHSYNIGLYLSNTNKILNTFQKSGCSFFIQRISVQTHFISKESMSINLFEEKSMSIMTPYYPTESEEQEKKTFKNYPN